MRYKDGTEVCEGDEVLIRSAGRMLPGRVVKVVLPGTSHALALSAPNGGVLIEGAGLGMSLTERVEDDDEVVFVRRSIAPPAGGF